MSDFPVTPSATSLAMRLRALTPARVGLGRSGVSQLTRDVLAFQWAHAQARDAVLAQLDGAALATNFAGVVTGKPVLRLHSQAADRAAYLKRPDLGRKLDAASRETLARVSPRQYDLAFVVADGLSALAVERHAQSLLLELQPHVCDWNVAPICIVEQGRVAIGDEIGHLLGAEIAVVMIGERPGLSSPDSLGAYITWQPEPGRTDAERVCISNIRAEGLTYTQATQQVFEALNAARTHRLTGVALETCAMTAGGSRQLKEGSTS